MRLHQDDDITQQDHADGQYEFPPGIGKSLGTLLTGFELTLALKRYYRISVDGDYDDNGDLEDLGRLKERSSDPDPPSRTLSGISSEKSRRRNDTDAHRIGGEHYEPVLEKIHRDKVYDEGYDYVDLENESTYYGFRNYMTDRETRYLEEVVASQSDVDAYQDIVDSWDAVESFDEFCASYVAANDTRDAL